MDRKDEIKRGIERLQEELDALLAVASLEGIKQISEFSDRDKIRAFDSLYHRALKYVQYLAENGYEQKDGDHYLYEAVLRATLGERIFDIINPLWR